MAVQFHSTAFMPRTITLALSSKDRKAIEQQIKALIELLDGLDGDPDLEDDELYDDPLELGEEIRVVPTLPLYAIDQSAGPINETRAYSDYRRLLHGVAA